MISAINSSYSKICNFFDFMRTKPKNSKVILLNIAESGGPKPHYSTSLYARLKSCTNKKSIQYDKNFDNKIRKLRPEWFLPRSYKSKIKKTKLLFLARNKKSRPCHKNVLYRELCSYTNKNNRSYDKSFDKKIRKLRPDWFFTRSDIVKINKQKLMSLKTKPKRSSKLGGALKNYTCKSSQAFDAHFKKTIRKLKPDWFKK